MSNEAVNPISLAFNGTGFQLGLFLPAFSFSFVALIGIPLNFSLCYVTLKYRKKHSTLGSNTGILIALYSFFEIVHQFGHFVFLLNIATGKNFYPFPSALLLQGPSLVALNSAAKMLVMLSADRLLSVGAPIFYWRMKQCHYLFAHILAIFGFNFYFIYVVAKAAEKYPNWMVSGSMNDVFGVPSVAPQLFYVNFGLICAAAVIYLLVAILVKFRAGVTNERLQKLYRSLCIIVVFNLGGYFICNMNTVLYILSVTPFTPVQFWFSTHCAALLLNIEAAMNAPILYWNSDDYQHAYNEEWKKAKKLLFGIKTKKVVAPTTKMITVVPLFSAHC